MSSLTFSDGKVRSNRNCGGKRQCLNWLRRHFFTIVYFFLWMVVVVCYCSLVLLFHRYGCFYQVEAYQKVVKERLRNCGQFHCWAVSLANFLFLLRSMFSQISLFLEQNSSSVERSEETEHYTRIEMDIGRGQRNIWVTRFILFNLYFSLFSYV